MGKTFLEMAPWLAEAPNGSLLKVITGSRGEPDFIIRKFLGEWQHDRGYAVHLNGHLFCAEFEKVGVCPYPADKSWRWAQWMMENDCCCYMRGPCGLIYKWWGGRLLSHVDEELPEGELHKWDPVFCTSEILKFSDWREE